MQVHSRAHHMVREKPTILLFAPMPYHRHNELGESFSMESPCHCWCWSSIRIGCRSIEWHPSIVWWFSFLLLMGRFQSSRSTLPRVSNPWSLPFSSLFWVSQVTVDCVHPQICSKENPVRCQVVDIHSLNQNHVMAKCVRTGVHLIHLVDWLIKVAFSLVWSMWTTTKWMKAHRIENNFPPNPLEKILFYGPWEVSTGIFEEDSK